jgi:putative transposase
LNPGKRTFQTFYSPDGIAGKLGDNYYEDKITHLNKRIDHICSIRDKIKKLSKKIRKNKQTIKNMNRRLSLLRTKIKNKICDMHWKTANFLCKNFETIIIPEFETQKMANKEQRKINKETTRGILGLSHYAFRMHLTHPRKYGSGIIY